MLNSLTTSKSVRSSKTNFPGPAFFFTDTPVKSSRSFGLNTQSVLNNIKRNCKFARNNTTPAFKRVTDSEPTRWWLRRLAITMVTARTWLVFLSSPSKILNILTRPSREICGKAAAGHFALPSYARRPTTRKSKNFVMLLSVRPNVQLSTCQSNP